MSASGHGVTLSSFSSLHQEVHIPSLEVLEEEIRWMKEHLSQLRSPIVFCHNDLLSKNIIYNKAEGLLPYSHKCIALCKMHRSGKKCLEKKQMLAKFSCLFRKQPLCLTTRPTSVFIVSGHVRFIDYEYTGYNYQAYDIGNHFNEFAGELSSAIFCEGWKFLS